MKPSKEEMEKRFAMAYDSFADAIFRHCYFRLRDYERAKDLMQESFVKTWKYLSGGTEVENLRAFLYRVANNLIVDFVRKKKEASLDELATKGFDPSAGAPGDMELRAASREMIHLLEKVDEKSREVIIMRYLDDLPVKDIAFILKESENAISVRLHRGLRKMRDIAENGGVK